MLCRRWGCHASARIETTVSMSFRNKNSCSCCCCCCCGAAAAAADVMLAVLTVSSVSSSGLMVVVVDSARADIALDLDLSLCGPPPVHKKCQDSPNMRVSKEKVCPAFVFTVTLMKQSRTHRHQISQCNPSTDPQSEPLAFPRDVINVLTMRLASRRSFVTTKLSTARWQTRPCGATR